MLKAGLENTGQPCASLPIMPESERRLLLEDWNATEKAYPRQNTVLDKILEQTQVRPFQTCIRFGDAEITYSQLLHRLEAIACELKRQGVQAGDRVGILMGRSLDLIPALLAVWRTGAIYVPMDLGFPMQRLAYMLEEANVKTVITTQALQELLPEGLNTTLIEDIPTQVQADLVRITPPSGKDSAIILFTSGSTGKPKGVELRHDAFLNVLLSTRDFLEFSPTSVMLALTTISFDISTNEIIMPLLGGGCVDLAEDGLAADGFGLAERIQTRQPTHVQATASTWKAVLTAGWQGDQKICLVSTGEALSRDLAEQLLTRCASLWNLYGPSETTVFSSAYRVESMPGQPMRIGRPIPNTQFYILDEFLQPVFPGAVGELFIGGEGVARGYWQKPELTGQRFLANPFRPDERMYHTGDLARYLPNGEVICLGRTDDQVKIHGVRVELGEVETALRSIPGVRDAVAAAWRDSRGDQQLVGYVICDPTTALEAADIRARLRENLPETMAPPYILFLESFPKTANGKVHRAALPAPQPANQAPGKAASPPATPTERLLAKAWAKVLEIDPQVIVRETDFMEIGGHSLLITPLMLEVRQQFQVSFNLRQFFEASTLMRFSALIDQKRKLASAGTNGRKPAQAVRNAEWGRQRMAFLQREAQLPTHIAPARGAVFQAPPAIRSIFLTGATGFLGAYIVAEIMQNSPVDLYCLVRPKRGEQARQRIERQMRHYQVWRDDPAWQSAWEERLHVVEGDVTLPRMGLADQTYETLARDIDAILHGAAHVNFIYPYEALRAANVLGIHEIIRFAFHSRIKQVHHLSTAAIWPMGAQYTFYEKDAIDHGKPLNLGYDEAKWVGEKCLLNAAERGLPVARYRPGEVGGDSLTGRCVTDHFLFACIKGFLQFGAFPALDIEVDVAPVDYVARAMVHLIFHGNTLGRAFHLTNPHRRHMSAALTYLRSLGYQFEEMPFETLRDRLIASSDFANNALFAYQAALQEMDNISLQLPTYDTRQALRELAGSGIACPPADEKLFETYLRYFWESGFLPAPVEIAIEADVHA
jgi:amino acid adenylation domain-containing protein/thioester reductase-like protein